MEKATARENRRQGTETRGKKKEKEEDKLRKTALEQISSGEVGKAVSRIRLHGLASMADPRVAEQMASKYPNRSREMPETVRKGKPVENLRAL